MELLSRVADLALTRLFNVLTRKLRYPFKAGDNVRDLESATRRLLAKKEHLKAQIEIAERNGQIPTPQVQQWLDEVEARKKQVEEIVEKYNQRRLLFKCFSPGCCSIYNLSRNAAKMLLDMQRLLNKEWKEEEIAITPVPPPVQEAPMPPTLTLFRDAVSNLEKALRCIKEEQVGMIGIWGMGGVGKTHLLKQINNSFINDSSFGVVIFVTASQSCTAEKLRKEIAKNQSLKQDGDASTQDIIFNFLKKRSFLLLLDDIWERIDLQKVGIPFPLGVVSGCKRKVVLTTRLRNVCGQMEVRKQIKVESLNHQDALSLFIEKVGEETINSHPRIRNLAGELVKELDGLPLAVITIGRAMYEKKDPSEWEYAINLLRKSQLHEVEHSCQEEERTFYRLKLSYDSLKSDILKDCFLSCCMWPEDDQILKSELIKCWMGLGLIKEFVDISEAYNTGYALIGHLTGACLLESDHESHDNLRMHSGDNVRMHDVLRDTAIWIARDNGKKKNKWIVPVRGSQSFDREIWHEAERISLMFCRFLEIPPITPTASTSKLTTLHIQSFRELKGLRNIRAFVTLKYLRLSFCKLDCFPIEICGLVQLQYLDLSGNYKMPSLPEELKSLVNLKFLILKFTGIHTIPPDVIGALKSLQVLDLYEHHIGDTKLTYLESLVFKELECLEDLRSLGICVESMSQLHKISQLPNVSVSSLGIHRLEESTSFSLISSFLWDENIQLRLDALSIVNSNVTQVVIEGNHQHPRWNFQALKILRIQNIRCLEEIIWKGVVPKELFPAVTKIRIDGCGMLKNVSWVLHLPCLVSLEVSKCSSMRQLIVCEKENHGENVADTVVKDEEKEVMLASTFPSLRHITLKDLPEMVSICHPTIAFPALKWINVRDCPKLKKLPFRPGNIPSKLRSVNGYKEWWEGLEWEDNSVKTSLQPFFKDIE